MGGGGEGAVCSGWAGCGGGVKGCGGGPPGGVRPG